MALYSAICCRLWFKPLNEISEQEISGHPPTPPYRETLLATNWHQFRNWPPNLWEQPSLNGDDCRPHDYTSTLATMLAINACTGLCGQILWCYHSFTLSTTEGGSRPQYIIYILLRNSSSDNCTDDAAHAYRVPPTNWWTLREYPWDSDAVFARIWNSQPGQFGWLSSTGFRYSKFLCKLFDVAHFVWTISWVFAVSVTGPNGRPAMAAG